MNNKKKTKEQLISEIIELHNRITQLEALLSEKDQTLRQMKEREKRNNEIFEEYRDAIYMTKREGEFIEVNQAALDLFGYTRDEMIGMNSKQIYANPADRKLFQKEIEKNGSVRDYEIKFKRKDGTEIDCSLTSIVRRANNRRVLGYQGIIRDTTEHKRIEAEKQRLMKELHSMSFIDDLTGLYNRRGFFSLAQKQLEIAKRLKKGMFIIFVDIDNLKWTNDTFGHREGDQSLVDTAEILKKSYREADVIARMGGDEFAIIAMENSETNDNILFSRLKKNLKSYNLKMERRYDLSMSVGIEHFDHKNRSDLHDKGQHN